MASRSEKKTPGSADPVTAQSKAAAAVPAGDQGVAPAPEAPATGTGRGRASGGKKAQKEAATAAPATPAEGAAGAAGGEVPSAPAPRQARQQVKVGRVVSDKMDKTVVVAVENTVTHRLYHRYLKRTSKFAAHDGEKRCKVGDVVEIVSSRPLSKTKRWRVREILKRAE